MRRDTTQRKELVDLLHYYKSTDPPSNTFPEFAQPDQSTSGLNPKSTSPRSESSDSTDSNIPIVVHKGVRSCTKDPLSNYKLYKNLSPNFHVFASQVSYIEIPKSVQDALKIPEWKEMKALEKNKTWEVVDLPRGKIIEGCNGCLQLNIGWMDRLKGIKLGWLPKDSL